MITLYHTSHQKEFIVNSNGLFGEFLFFSPKIYHMSHKSNYVHELELNEDDVISAGSLFYHDNCHKLNNIVKKVMELFECDEETAQELLSEREHIFTNYDDSFELQRLTALCAKTLGYRAVLSEDEQGCVYIVDMLNEKLLSNKQQG